MKENKYYLVVVKTFIKYVWCETVKSETGKEKTDKNFYKNWKFSEKFKHWIQKIHGKVQNQLLLLNYC